MNSPSIPWQDDLLIKIAGVKEQHFPQGALYVVGLPIGNLGDMTLRALWVLAHVDAVAAEDTRETRKLLEHYGISTHLLSVREHNERRGAEQICEMLSDGRRVAVVTDAGTPAISDPGARVVESVRRAGFRVVPIPGASAVVTALSAAGLTAQTFRFAGFLPSQGKARRCVLDELTGTREAFVLYEAPHRIDSLLKDLQAGLSGDRRVVIARELTKRFEEVAECPAKELAQWSAQHEARGEYAVVVDEEPKRASRVDLSSADIRWIAALQPWLPASRLAAVAAKVTGLPRQQIYERLTSEKTAHQEMEDHKDELPSYEH